MKVLDMFSLQGKVALVTGAGDPKGYGAQCAEALYEAGALVYIAARSEDKMAAFVEKYPGMRWKKLDMTDEVMVKNIIPEIVSEAGKLDILVNNAVSRVACKKWDQPMDVFDESLRANASGLFALTRIASEEMAKHKSGSIINIGSYMGILGLAASNYVGTGNQTDGAEWPSPIYHYEKGGMLNFTRWAASVLGKDGIRVNYISLIGCSSQIDPESRFGRQHAANTCLGRICNSTDLKGGIVYLASDASAFVTGAHLPIDGGYSAI